MGNTWNGHSWEWSEPTPEQVAERRKAIREYDRRRAEEQRTAVESAERRIEIQYASEYGYSAGRNRADADFTQRNLANTDIQIGARTPEFTTTHRKAYESQFLKGYKARSHELAYWVHGRDQALAEIESGAVEPLPVKDRPKGTMTFQGYRDQWIAEFQHRELLKQQGIVVPETNFTLRDVQQMLNQPQVNARKRSRSFKATALAGFTASGVLTLYGIVVAPRQPAPTRSVQSSFLPTPDITFNCWNGKLYYDTSRSTSNVFATTSDFNAVGLTCANGVGNHLVTTPDKLVSVIDTKTPWDALTPIYDVVTDSLPETTWTATCTDGVVQNVTRVSPPDVQIFGFIEAESHHPCNPNIPELTMKDDRGTTFRLTASATSTPLDVLPIGTPADFIVECGPDNHVVFEAGNQPAGTLPTAQDLVPIGTICDISVADLVVRVPTGKVVEIQGIHR